MQSLQNCMRLEIDVIAEEPFSLLAAKLTILVVGSSSIVILTGQSLV